LVSGALTGAASASPAASGAAAERERFARAAVRAMETTGKSLSPQTLTSPTRLGKGG
jgi:hypothetical protein